MKTSPRSGGFFQLFWQVYGENIRFLAFPGYLGKMVQPWENSRSIGISDKPGMVGGQPEVFSRAEGKGGWSVQGELLDGVFGIPGLLISMTQLGKC